MARHDSYREHRTSIHSILMDQRELELNPIRVATERANLKAAQATAEFEENLVKDQLENMRMDSQRKKSNQEINDVRTVIELIKESDPARAEDLKDQLVNQMLSGIDWIK